MAPEVFLKGGHDLRKKSYENRPNDSVKLIQYASHEISFTLRQDLEFEKSVDYWAIGVLIYELTSGTAPFNGPQESIRCVIQLNDLTILTSLRHCYVFIHFQRSNKSISLKIVKAWTRNNQKFDTSQPVQAIRKFQKWNGRY